MDLDSNAGKIFCAEESGCRVLVDAVDEYEGAYRVWFRSYGVCGWKGGTLVSGCQTVPAESFSGQGAPLRQTAVSGEDSFWIWETFVSMTAAVDGADCPCIFAGESSLIYKNGNPFGFHLAPGDRIGNRPISADWSRSRSLSPASPDSPPNGSPAPGRSADFSAFFLKIPLTILPFTDILDKPL